MPPIARGRPPWGPAVFLRMPGYVGAAAHAMDPDQARGAIRALLAEAYVLAAGGTLVHSTLTSSTRSAPRSSLRASSTRPNGLG
jgi:hypothetical protein